jgi:hypothetical protein
MQTNDNKLNKVSFNPTIIASKLRNINIYKWEVMAATESVISFDRVKYQKIMCGCQHYVYDFVLGTFECRNNPAARSRTGALFPSQLQQQRVNVYLENLQQFEW